MSLADLEMIRAFMRNAHEIDINEAEKEEKKEQEKEGRREGKGKGDGRVNKRREESEGEREIGDSQGQIRTVSTYEIEKSDVNAPREILGVLTVEQISRGTGLTMQRIRQAMVIGVETKAAGQFVHWAHPRDPGQTRYALYDHAVRHNLTGWNHGFDLRNEE